MTHEPSPLPDSIEELFVNEVKRFAIRTGETAQYWSTPFQALHLERAELSTTDVDAPARLGRARIKVHATAMNTNDSPTGDERILLFNLQAHDRNDRTLTVIEPDETHALGLPTGRMINHYELVFALEGLELTTGETLWITLIPMK